MPFDKGNKIGNRFTSDKQPPRDRVGRKRNTFKDCMKKVFNKTIPNGMSEEDCERWEQFLIGAKKSELEAMAKNPDAPIYALNLATAIVADMKNGRTSTVDAIYQRHYGKAKKLDLTTNGKDMQVQAIQVEVIDSRDQIEKSEEDDDEE